MALKTKLDGIELADLNTPADASREDVVKEGVSWLEKQMASLKARLEEERANGLPSLQELEKQLSRAQKKAEKLQTKIQKAKLLAKLRKKEIADWKQWYEGVPSIDKSQERAKLQAETLWRLEAIANQEKKIGRLETEEREALTKVVALEEKIEAIQAGAYDIPLEEDPRLLELQAAIQRIKALG
ncbi:MAG: hypothetical protein AB4290_22655 [Spirulina sp.]